MGEMISFGCPAGHSASGYLAAAAAGGGRRRAVVVLQEWWGLNDQIKGVADRFAAAGITALAPDLYAGRVTGDPDEANHLMSGLDWVGATEQEVRGAVQHLGPGGAKSAVLGFCMGGALSVIAAAKIPEVHAAVCFYGIPPAEQADGKDIGVPFQGHFADKDDWCTPAAVDALEASLRAGGVSYEVHRYEARHGFFNETLPDAYEPAASARAWERTLAFLNARL